MGTVDSIRAGTEINRTSSAREILERVAGTLRDSLGDFKPHLLGQLRLVPAPGGVNGVLTELTRSFGRDLSPTPRILEVGCGDGYLQHALRGALGRPISYTGIDLVKRPSWAGTANGGLIEADAIDWLSATNQEFDITLSSSVLEHVQFDWRLLELCLAHTAPGGLSIHVVPGSLASLAYPLHGIRHYSLTLVAEILERIRALGYTRVAVYSMGSPLEALVQGITRGLPSLLPGTRSAQLGHVAVSLEKFARRRAPAKPRGRGIFYCIVVTT